MKLVFLNILIAIINIDMYETRVDPLTIPKNNSHYIEGESRYIWLGDGDGELRLVDLWQRSRDYFTGGCCNEYYLYTRNNKENPDKIDYKQEKTINNSRYNTRLPLNVITHGWTGDGNTESVTVIRKAFLNASDCNVIVLDWNREASGFYPTAAKRASGVGKALGEFIKWLIKSTGGSWNRIHLVGFSLGAHVVGNAGRAVDGLAQRVTGLDPAGPLFNSIYGDICIKATDGKYVEIIHTDGGVAGIKVNVGHVDFYPNGGIRPQPGCYLVNPDCSHYKAAYYFAASISYRGKLFGRKCNSILEAFTEKCKGERLKMGSDDLKKSGRGIYGLKTTEEWPYNDNDIATEVNEANFYF